MTGMFEINGNVAGKSIVISICVEGIVITYTKSKLEQMFGEHQGQDVLLYKNILAFDFKECGWTAGYFEFQVSAEGYPQPVVVKYDFGAATPGKIKKTNEVALKAKEYIISRIQELRAADAEAK